VAVPPNVDVQEHQVAPPNFPVALRQICNLRLRRFPFKK